MSTDPATAPPPAALRGAETSLSILVVDDESGLRDMLSRSFSREGHRVTAVGDGRAATERASTDHLDIVLLVVAPGPRPDGYEVRRAGRGPRTTRTIITPTTPD